MAAATEKAGGAAGGYRVPRTVAAAKDVAAWPDGNGRLGGRAAGVAGEEGQRPGGRRGDDPHVVGQHREHRVDGVAGVAQQDLVTRLELVEVIERVGPRDAVAGDDHVAEVARLGRAGPV